MVFKLGSSELKASTLTTWPQPWHRKREFLWHIFGRNLFRERFLLHFLAFSDVRQNQWSNERRSKSKYLRQKWNKIGNRSGRRNKIKKTFSEKLKSSEWIYAASKYSFAPRERLLSGALIVLLAFKFDWKKLTHSSYYEVNWIWFQK